MKLIISAFFDDWSVLQTASSVLSASCSNRDNIYFSTISAVPDSGIHLTGALLCAQESPSAGCHLLKVTCPAAEERFFTEELSGLGARKISVLRQE